jgi:hypothetical protein
MFRIDWSRGGDGGRRGGLSRKPGGGLGSLEGSRGLIRRMCGNLLGGSWDIGLLRSLDLLSRLGKQRFHALGGGRSLGRGCGLGDPRGLGESCLGPATEPAGASGLAEARPFAPLLALGGGGIPLCGALLNRKVLAEIHFFKGRGVEATRRRDGV